MTGVSIAIGLVGPVLAIAGQIIVQVDTAKRNREKCKLLSDRVGTIVLLLNELQNHMNPEVWMKQLLGDLQKALSDGLYLVESCQEKRTWSHVFKTQKKANKFDALDHRISRILEPFHLVKVILILSTNNGRFFENVLHNLLQDGACKRLPQDVKEHLKSSIMRLTNTDNMSSEAQGLLEWIKSDITYSDASTSGSSGAQKGKESSSTGDELMANILNQTKQIMDKAGEHNGDDEIQRLVRFLEQLTDIIQRLQTSELSLDPKTLGELKQDLKRIYGDINFYNGKEHNKVKRVMLCVQERPGPSITADDVLKDAYKIEYYNQVLLIALSKAK